MRSKQSEYDIYGRLINKVSSNCQIVTKTTVWEKVRLLFKEEKIESKIIWENAILEEHYNIRYKILNKRKFVLGTSNIILLKNK